MQRSNQVRTSLLLLGLLLLAAQPQLSSAARRRPVVRRWQDCDSDMQVVMCGQIPFEDRKSRRICCFTHREVPLSPDTQAEKDSAKAAAVSIQANIMRPDLDPVNPDMGMPVSSTYRTFASCLPWIQTPVPVFSNIANTAANVIFQNAPNFTAAARPGLIQRIREAAIAKMPAAFRTELAALRTVNNISRFIHPGTPLGPAEIVAMRQKVNGQLLPSQPQLTAWWSGLINGTSVPPKVYSGPNGTWAPPRDCPISGYGPDYAMSSVRIKYGGVDDTNIACPATYPAKAPRNLCGHISFVELDGTMAYRQALAHLVTGDNRYLINVMNIISGWMSRNFEWGIRSENGPLEAGWGIAAMAKSLELLRNKLPMGYIGSFARWVGPVLMTPQMDWYEDVIVPTAITKNNIPNVYGNWDSTIAEAMMAVAILTDNRTRFDRAVQIYHATVKDYFRWGKDQNLGSGRLVGECTETLRDLYHSQFGIGGLVQVAEMAWQQNEDLYSSNSYALVSVMETHARLIRAGLNRNTTVLPAGFRYYDRDMPKPPPGCKWQFDIRKQLWTALNSTTGALVSELRDGLKYLVGIDFQPAGWEMGYAHFVGRLGMSMPETALLLQQAWPDWHIFHWGAGSLSHAALPWQLWRPGVSQATLCA